MKERNQKEVGKEGKRMMRKSKTIFIEKYLFCKTKGGVKRRKDGKFIWEEQCSRDRGMKNKRSRSRGGEGEEIKERRVGEKGGQELNIPAEKMSLEGGKRRKGGMFWKMSSR